MSKVEKILIPIKEYNKPLLELKGNSKWIVERLEGSRKAAKAAKEATIDELHMPGLSREAAKATKANLHKDSATLRSLGELIRHEKALAYEEQLRHAEGLEKAYANNPKSAEFAKEISDFFQGLYA